MTGRLLPLVALGLVVGCTSKNPSPSSGREPSSNASADVLWRDPVSQKTFWEEFSAAKDGRNETDQSDPEFKIGVFFKWMKANPRAVIEDLRREGGVLPVAVGTSRRASRVADEKVYLVAGTDEILSVVEKVSAGVDFQPWHHRLSTSPHPRTIWTMTTSDWKADTWGRLAQETLDAESYVGRDFERHLYGRIDFVNQLARKFSHRVNESIIGIGGLTSKQWTDISRAIVDDLYFNPLAVEKVTEQADQGRQALRQLVEAHLKRDLQAPADSYFARFIADRGASLSEPLKEVLSRFLVHELSAAEISQSMAAHILDQLFAHGRIGEAHRAVMQNQSRDLEFMAKEALRFLPAIPYLATQASQDLSIGSVRIPRGSKVIVVTSAIHFDPAVFENPNEFRPQRWAGDFSRFARLPAPFFSVTTDDVRPRAFGEALAVVKEVLRQPGLRRAEGHFGQLDHRTIFVPGKLKDVYRYSVPEHLSVEYDVAAVRNRFEIPTKDYPYEEYLQDYDRDAYRQCLGGLSRLFQTPETPVEGTYEGITRNLREVGRILRQTPAIIRSIGVSRKNLNRENKHLLFCRMPERFRQCISRARVDIQTETGAAHRAAYDGCKNFLRPNEQLFYAASFLEEELDLRQVSFEQARRPADPAYEFEDQIKFYDRYRARESMMNPAGFGMAVPKILFYVRLNIDFRMCIGGPVLKHKFTLGRDGRSKEEQYEICKDGVVNPQTFKKEGGLSLIEKYYYERLMLDRDVTFADIRRKELGR